MNYYSVLGVPKSATDKDIKSAYRRLAKEHHPDRTGGDDTKFKQINEAYDTLKDPDKRSLYDNPQPQNNFRYNSQNVNDIFSSFFGGMQSQRMRRNANIGISVKLTLEDVMQGKDVVGRYALNTGKEEIANIRVPAGVENGTTIRFQGLGDDSIRNVPRGDLHVKIVVINHKRFTRDRLHLKTKCSINVLELVLGTEVIIEKLGGGPLVVKIPPGTNPGTVLSVAGHGLPEMNTGRVGNLYLEVKGITPKITDYEILQKVRNLNDEID
jgi:curved DNA-binding protein